MFERARDLRYGENPHQRAAHYRARGHPSGWWETPYSTADRAMSYLNLLDAEAAWQLVTSLSVPHGLSFSETGFARR